VSKRASAKVYAQAEEYKIGWVHGFYACVPDEGTRYGLCPNAPDQYRKGYRDGLAARR